MPHKPLLWISLLLLLAVGAYVWYLQPTPPEPHPPPAPLNEPVRTDTAPMVNGPAIPQLPVGTASEAPSPPPEQPVKKKKSRPNPGQARLLPKAPEAHPVPPRDSLLTIPTVPPPLSEARGVENPAFAKMDAYESLRDDGAPGQLKIPEEAAEYIPNTPEGGYLLRVSAEIQAETHDMLGIFQNDPAHIANNQAYWIHFFPEPFSGLWSQPVDLATAPVGRYYIALFNQGKWGVLGSFLLK